MSKMPFWKSPVMTAVYISIAIVIIANILIDPIADDHRKQLEIYDEQFRSICEGTEGNLLIDSSGKIDRCDCGNGIVELDRLDVKSNPGSAYRSINWKGCGK